MNLRLAVALLEPTISSLGSSPEKMGQVLRGVTANARSTALKQGTADGNSGQVR